MSSLLSSSASAQSAGIESKQSAKRFKYISKHKKTKFFLRLVPLGVGYDPASVGYHQNLASLSYKDKKEMNLVISCLGTDCPGCKRFYRQLDETKGNRGKNFFRETKGQKVGQVFAAYECFINVDGTVEYGANPEPQLIEYSFNRSMICLDWDNLVEAVNSAKVKLNDSGVAGDIPALDPLAGIVIQVDKRSEPVAGSPTNRTAYKHTATDIQAPLPEGWLEALKQYDVFDKLHFSLSSAEMDHAISISDAVEAVKADASLTSAEKASKLDSLGESLLREVVNTDLVRVINNYNKEKTDDFAGSAQSQNSYTPPSLGQSSAAQSFQTPAAAPVAPAPVAPSASPAAPVAPSASPVAPAPVAPAPVAPSASPVAPAPVAPSASPAAPVAPSASPAAPVAPSAAPASAAAPAPANPALSDDVKSRIEAIRNKQKQGS